MLELGFRISESFCLQFIATYGCDHQHASHIQNESFIFHVSRETIPHPLHLAALLKLYQMILNGYISNKRFCYRVILECRYLLNKIVSTTPFAIHPEWICHRALHKIIFRYLLIVEI